MSETKKCDRCGKMPLLTDMSKQISINPEPTIWLDLCLDCYDNFVKFIQEKGSTVLKRTFYIGMDFGKKGEDHAVVIPIPDESAF